MENIIEFKGCDKSYKILNDTYYHIDTPDKTVRALEKIRLSGERVVFDFGDIVTGTSWKETFDIVGKIGRSSGFIKTPILLNNVRSTGGGAILTHCILKIVSSKGKRTLFEHGK